MKFTLRQKCLLDASGELSPAERQKLIAKVNQDPAANAEYEASRESFAVFGALPLPEPSAAERKLIPETIKGAIHAALGQREKQARRAKLLFGCAAGLALALGVTIFMGLLSGHRQSLRQQAQVAKIQAMIQRVTLPVDRAPMQPLVITTPSQDENNGLSTLAVVPEVEPLNVDPSAPPGSF